jgi:hypothetical protein
MEKRLATIVGVAEAGGKLILLARETQRRNLRIFNAHWVRSVMGFLARQNGQG